MSTFYNIGDQQLSLLDISKILSEEVKIKLSKTAEKKIIQCRQYLNNKISDEDTLIYGINTGFGSLCDRRISDSRLEDLQKNLVLSHACGIGEQVPKEIVRIMLLLKIQSLSYGNSGIQLITINRLIDMFNQNILPVVYQQGSLGASGDLAPLAHLSLPLLGMGEVNVPDVLDNGDYIRKDSAEILKEMKWDPISLRSKEGLALLNGTQFMSAYGVYLMIQSRRLSYLSDLISSISFEAFDGRSDAFDEVLHAIRPHKGQVATALNLREFLDGSDIQKRKKEHVQDPYSFRCIPQVHGASKDVIDHVANIFTTEINSVTDNPIIFYKEDKIISGGNFHGQILSLSLDYLSMALSELGNISERRTYQLISGSRGLPDFLVLDSGLNSGMMITQYTAASIVSQNKQLCTPASVDSIVSSNGQEDHVSMGANAATKSYKILENLERILAIELMNASQAISFRDERSSDFIESFIDSYRNEVPLLENDKLLHTDIKKSIYFLKSVNVDQDLL